MSFSKKTRESIHSKFNGHCAYCGAKISVKEMEIDHIIPKYHIEEGYVKVDYDKDDLRNLNPACRDCNRYKDTFTIEKFRIQLQTITDRLKEKWIFRIALKYGLVYLNDLKVKFYFEKLEKPKC